MKKKRGLPQLQNRGSILESDFVKGLNEEKEAILGDVKRDANQRQKSLEELTLRKFDKRGIELEADKKRRHMQYLDHLVYSKQE